MKNQTRKLLPATTSKTSYDEVVITPAKAKEWLKLSIGNRTINKARVESYAQEMTDGRWCVTNQDIGFDSTGALIDGHHRLHAIVLSGVSVRMGVKHGIDPFAASKIDVGQSREPGQVLSMVYQIKNSVKVAAIGKIMLVLKEKAGWGERCDPEELAALFYDNPKSFEFAIRYGKVPSSVTGPLAYFYSMSPSLVSELAEKLVKKTLIDPDSAESGLVMFMSRLPRGVGGMTWQKRITEHVTTAIYHKLKGNKVKQLRASDTAMIWMKANRKLDL